MVERLWSPDVKAIGDRIASLTVTRARELGKYLAEVHGIQARALPVPRLEEHQVRTDEPDEPPVPQLRKVVLEGYQANRKISVIRTLRQLKQLGLREAVTLVDNTPQVLDADLSEEDAQRLKEQLEEAGAAVSVR
jgi:large subunit ribosomal protein L7/L12